MAWGDEIDRDFGMGGGRAPGPGGGGHPGIGMEEIDADVVAVIAAELEAGADAGVSRSWQGEGEAIGHRPSFSSPTGPEGALQAEAVRQAIAQQVAASQANTGFSTATGAGGFTGGSQLYDMGMDPTFANTGGWGVPQTTVMNPLAAPLEGYFGGIQKVAENISPHLPAPFGTSYVNQLGETVPNTWDNPYVSQNYDDWGQAGTSNVNQTAISRALAGPDPTTNWAGGFNPNLDNYPSDWENVTQGMNPQGIPDYSSPLSPEGALGGPGRPAFSSPISPEGALTADQIGPTSPFTSPLSPEGAISGPISPYDASQSLNEYEMPSRQQQRVMRDIAQDDYMGTPMAPAFSSPFSPEGALTAGQTFDDYQPEEWGGPDTLEVERTAAGIVAEGEGILQGSVTKADLEKATSEPKLEELLTDKALEQSKRLTKEEKKANVAARRKAEESYVAYRDTLNFQVEMLRSRLATAINTHGKDSKEAKKVKRDVRNKEDDLRMWERSDIYIKSYGKVNYGGAGQNLPFVGTALKGLNSIEDYFHSLGKTERRSPKDVLQDMKDNPEKYERVGAEISAAQLVRNMYSFLRKAPMDVAAAAAKEPAYLRYLINLNVNKQPIPTSYSSNWKNDISDAWIYG